MAATTPAAAATATSTAAAARVWPVRQEGPYVIVETPHYIVKTEHKAEVAQLIANQQEAVFAELYRRLSGTRAGVGPLQRLQIIFFLTKAKYLEVMGKEGEGTQGRYIPGKNMIAGWMPADEIDNMLKTLRHEGTHQFVEQFIGPKCPVWLNEGLAVFFEESQFKNGVLDTAQVPAARVGSLKRALEGGKLIPLRRMIEMGGEEWTAALRAEAPQGHLEYNEAWSMVHFLQGADGGKYRAPLLQFISGIAHSLPVAEAWDKAFGAGSTPAFEKRWQEYIKSLKPTGGPGCRTNLRLLGMLVAKNFEWGNTWKDMDAMYQAAIDGKLGTWVVPMADGSKLDIKDKEAVKTLFRCSLDTGASDKPSYELFEGNEGEPPGIRCSHHDGYVLETVYEKNDKGGWDVNIVTRPTPKSGAASAAKSGATSATKSAAKPPAAAAGGTR
jgi:hypothetical protein